MDLKSRTLETKIKDTWKFVFLPKQVDKGNNAVFTVTRTELMEKGEKRKIEMKTKRQRIKWR